MMRRLKKKLPDDLQATLRAFEKTFDVTLTLHDQRGILTDPEGNPLCREYLTHRNPYCESGRYGRKSIAGWNMNCLNDCAKNVELESSRTPEPFLHTCWKGVTELVVPILHHNETSIILYAGPFLSGKKTMYKISKVFSGKLRNLPETDTLVTMSLLLRSIGKGLIACALEMQKQNESFPNRKELIRDYISRNLHRSDTSLEGLAKELALSISRTRHLVSEYFGISFKSLLWRERMIRAKALLLSGMRTPKEVAESVGIPEISYFHRRFKQFHGVTPGCLSKN